MDLFPDLDPKKVAKELKLEERAAERSFRKEPLRPDGQLDDIENEIIEYVELDKKQAHQLFEDQLQSYAHRLASLDFQGRFTAIHQIAPDCVTEFRRDLAKGQDALHERRRDLVEHEKERDIFRRKHGLARPARTHSSAAASLKWGFLFLLLVIESVLNGSFLALGSEQGLVGGTTLALAFAALNVGGAFLAGVMGARLLVHRHAFLKMIGALAVVSWLACAFALNLALAHYREVAGELNTEASRQVINRLQEAPFHLNDIQSWVLFGLGILFAIAAFVDSLLLFDPYFGYTGVEKRLRKARSRYQNLKADLVDDLKEIYADFSEKLTEIGQDLSKRAGEYDRIVWARKGLVDQFTAKQTQLEKAANSILSIYRSARGLPTSGVYRLDRINVSANNPDKKKREEIERIVSDAQTVLRTQADLLQKEFQKGLARYDQIDSLVGEGRDRDGSS
jgi:hypothetical protein